MTAQVVVVTGASGGIGRAVATAFGARGARVALLARGEKGLAGAARDVRAGGGSALLIPVDVADQAQVFAAADRVEDELGPIDVWVNVAFTSVFAPFEKIHPDEYRRVTEVSYLGYVYGTMAALQKMKPRDRGTIVQVGSALAYRGIPLQTAYCGAKHAIQGFHEALRCELLHEHSNVHVTMVQMPAVNTPQFSWVLSRLPHHAQPVPPIYQPEVAARGVLYAADHPQAAGVLGRRQHRRHPGRQRHRTRACWTGTSARPGSPPSRPSRNNPRTPRRTCGNRPTDPTARTSARTASSTARPRTPRRNCGPRTTTACSPPRQAASLAGAAALLLGRRR